MIGMNNTFGVVVEGAGTGPSGEADAQKAVRSNIKFEIMFYIFET